MSGAICLAVRRRQDGYFGFPSHFMALSGYFPVCTLGAPVIEKETLLFVMHLTTLCSWVKGVDLL